jgi:putative two-component system response regulator
MDTDKQIIDAPDSVQLEKYATDLVKIYRSEKEKTRELEAIKNELEETYLDTIHRLARAAEYKDDETPHHIMRVSRYSALLAEKLGMSDKEVQDILYAAPMHDVGKIGIPESILMKPDRLTPKEFGIIKTHTVIGANLLANLLAYSKAKVLKLAEEIALFHHEKWNGKGYPRGLSGEKIPLSARIVGLADVFDALTSKRPYKEPYPLIDCIDIIARGRGEDFDPKIVDVLLKHMDEVLKIKEEVDAAQDINRSNITRNKRNQL